jgi:glycosyltransferase 2 family protein
VSTEATTGPLRRRRHRRPADVVAVVVGAAGFLVAAGLVGPVTSVSPPETEVFRAINGLPDAIAPPIKAVMLLGTLLAIPVVAAVCLLARRFLMAVSVGSAGIAAYLAAKLAKTWIGEPRPKAVLTHVHVRDSVGGLGFPSGHAAVSAAICVAALPYLPPRWRPFAILVPIAVAFARIYVGAHLPLDVVGGAGLGVAVGSLVHIVIGVPIRARRPDAVRPPGDRPAAA